MEYARNGRNTAPDLVMDLSKSDQEIHRELRAKWPLVIDLWWELEMDERSGWVYNRNRCLVRLVHVVA